MAAGDLTFFETSNAKFVGGLKYAVAAGTVSSINPGEPVQKLAGAAYATAMLTNSPTATNRVVGIATQKSNETAAADGFVVVAPATNGQLMLANPKVLATWNTQAKYNALVGSRVLIDLTSSTYTLLATDGAGNGCIVEYLDVAQYPGKVAFSFSPLVDYRNV